MSSRVMKKRKGKKTGFANRSKRDGNREEVSRYAGDAYDLAKRTWSGLNAVRRLINIEEKFNDTGVTQSPDQNGVLTCLTQLAQGTTVNTRVGNSVKVQHLECTGRVVVNAAVTTFSLCRVVVLRDMEGQGTAPTGADVFETLGTSSAPRQFFDWGNRKRFAVLYDELIALTPLTGGNSIATFHYSVQLEKHTLYRGTTAAAASDGEGSIYLCCVSDEATNTPSVNCNARIVYTDD